MKYASVIAVSAGVIILCAGFAPAEEDRVTRAEKAEAICTGAVGDDVYRRWEIAADSQACTGDSDNICTIWQKKDHSVTVDHQCEITTGMDDNEAARPVYGGSSSPRPTQQQ